MVNQETGCPLYRFKLTESHRLEWLTRVLGKLLYPVSCDPRHLHSNLVWEISVWNCFTVSEVMIGS